MALGSRAATQAAPAGDGIRGPRPAVGAPGLSGEPSSHFGSVRVRLRSAPWM